METFTRLFRSLLVFVYHYFDRMVINVYLSGLSRPEQVVHFARAVIGLPIIGDENRCQNHGCSASERDRSNSGGRNTIRS
jgi:hypothetical protein